MADIRDFSPGWSVARLADEFGMDRRTAAKR
ncbi:terminase small subunit, partial [Stenotrophomonas sp. Betaine-02u-21]